MATHSRLLAWRIPWTVQFMDGKELDMTEYLSLSLFNVTMLRHHRKLMMALEHSLISTQYLPLFLALLVFLRTLARTLMCIIMAARKDSRKTTRP